MPRKGSFTGSSSSSSSSEKFPLVYFQPKSYGTLVASYEFLKYARSKQNEQVIRLNLNSF